jgi:hypothetical protein
VDIGSQALIGDASRGLGSKCWGKTFYVKDLKYLAKM